MKTKRIAHRIYEITAFGFTFQIDGQNHEGESNEWELFIIEGNENTWCDTYPTKKDALNDIERVAELSQKPRT